MATRTISTAGGNWNATTAWVEAAVPTSADDVVATGTSGALTINVAAQCRSIDLTGYTSTLTKTASVALTIGDASGGALKFPTTGWTYTTNSAGGDTYVFVSTSNAGGTGWGVDFGGKTPNSMSFNGVGGKWVLTRALAQNVNGTVNLIAGELDTNSLAHTFGFFNTNGTGVRTLSLGSTALATATWDGSVTTNLTLSTTTAVVTLGGSFAPFLYGGTMDWGGITFRTVTTSNFTIRESSATTAFTTGFTVANLSHVAAAQMTFFCPVHVTGTLTTSGTSVTARLLVTSTTLGTPQVVTVDTTVTATFVDYRDITGAGAASWNLAAITGGSGDLGGNTGITLTTPANQYWIIHTGTWGVTANWASTTGGVGGTGRIPLVQDTAIFDANSFSAGGQTVTASATTRLSAITTAAATNTPAFVLGTATFYGSVVLTGVTFTAAALNLVGRGTHTLNIGPSTSASVAINAIVGTYTLAGALTTTSSLTVTTGTFASASFAITTTQMTLSQSQTALFGTSTITLTVASINAVVLTGNSSFPTNADFSGTTLRITGLDTGLPMTFQTQGWTFGTLHLVGTADATAGLLTLSGTTNTRWAAWILDPGMNLRFTGADQTIGSLSMNGTSFGYMRLRASGISSPHHTDFDITGDLEIIMKLRADTWTPAGQSALVSKDGTNHFAYRFSLTTTGALELELSTNGTSFVTTALSTATVPSTGVANGTDKWVRVTRVQSTGIIQFFLSNDGTTWTQLGSNVAGTTVALNTVSGTSSMLLGQSNNLNGSNNNFNGRMYRAIVRSGIAGTTVVDLDLTTWLAGSVSQVDTAATPKTWSIAATTNNQPPTPGHSLVGSTGGHLLAMDLVDPHANVWAQNTPTDTTYNGYVTPSSTQWLSTPSATALNLAGDLDLAVKVRATDWTPATKQYLASKGANATVLSWRFALETSGALSLVTTTDGSTFRTATSSAATGITDNTDYWVRVTYASGTGSVKFYTSADGGTWVQLGTTQTGTSGVLYASAGALYFGRGESAAFNWTGRIHELILRNGIDGAIVANPDYANRTLQVVDRAVIDNVVGGGGANWVATNSASSGTNTGWTFAAAVIVLPLLSVAATVYQMSIPPSASDVVLPLINAPPTVFSPQVFRTGGVSANFISAPSTVYALVVAVPHAPVSLAFLAVAATVFAPTEVLLGATTRPDPSPAPLPSDTSGVPSVGGLTRAQAAAVLAAPLPQFVAVGYAFDNDGAGPGGTAQATTSLDGKEWTPLAPIAAMTTVPRAVVWAPTLELWVTVGESGYWATSKDGVTWTTRPRFTTYTLADLAWSGSQFLAVSYRKSTFSDVNGTEISSYVFTSADGINWTPRIVTMPIHLTSATPSVRSFSGVIGPFAVTWADGAGWVVAQSFSAYLATLEGSFPDDIEQQVGLIAQSPDGINWAFIGNRYTYTDTDGSENPPIITENRYHYLYEPDLDFARFREFSESGANQILNEDITSIRWSKEQHLLVATSNNGVLTSSDGGQNWYGDKYRYTTDDPGSRVPKTDGIFAFGGFNDGPLTRAAWSPTKATWVASSGQGLAWSPALQLFVIGGAGQSFVYTSPNALDWTYVRQLQGSGNQAHENNGWAYSTDGQNWLPSLFPDDFGNTVASVVFQVHSMAWGGGGSPIRARGALGGSGVAATMGDPIKTMVAVEPGVTVMKGNASRKDQRTAHAAETKLLDPLVRLIEKLDG